MTTDEDPFEPLGASPADFSVPIVKMPDMLASLRPQLAEIAKISAQFQSLNASIAKSSKVFAAIRPPQPALNLDKILGAGPNAGLGRLFKEIGAASAATKLKVFSDSERISSFAKLLHTVERSGKARSSSSRNLRKRGKRHWRRHSSHSAPSEVVYRIAGLSRQDQRRLRRLVRRIQRRLADLIRRLGWMRSDVSVPLHERSERLPLRPRGPNAADGFHSIRLRDALVAA